jgi:geranylgeranyl transferase type-2 subunit beta
MTSSLYLDMLDELLRPGISGLSETFRAAQIGFVVGCQQPDGGFCGRQGGSDIYYTDFALRTLAWLAPDHAAFERAADYLAGLNCSPSDVVACFSLLGVQRLVERHCRDVVGGSQKTINTSSLLDWLRGKMLPGGGLARLADCRVSAYHTFLGSLCFQLLGDAMPAIGDAVRAISGMKRPDGGYAEMADQAASQTNATAAAVAFLLMHDALPADTADTAGFLTAMQGGDGGLKSHAAAPCGDLLSTFTGLLTLSGLGGLDKVDLPAAARFLHRTAHAGGGFLACEGDETPDVEYAYYGIGTIALLHLAAALRDGI